MSYCNSLLNMIIGNNRIIVARQRSDSQVSYVLVQKKQVKFVTCCRDTVGNWIGGSSFGFDAWQNIPITSE